MTYEIIYLQNFEIKDPRTKTIQIIAKEVSEQVTSEMYFPTDHSVVFANKKTKILQANSGKNDPITVIREFSKSIFRQVKLINPNIISSKVN